MASNEELQSSNEELQSVNEELYTVNAENPPTSTTWPRRRRLRPSSSTPTCC